MQLPDNLAFIQDISPAFFESDAARQNPSLQVEQLAGACRRLGIMPDEVFTSETFIKLLKVWQSHDYGGDQQRRQDFKVICRLHNLAASFAKEVIEAALIQEIVEAHKELKIVLVQPGVDIPPGHPRYATYRQHRTEDAAYLARMRKDLNSRSTGDAHVAPEGASDETFIKLHRALELVTRYYKRGFPLHVLSAVHKIVVTQENIDIHSKAMQDRVFLTVVEAPAPAKPLAVRIQIKLNHTKQEMRSSDFYGRLSAVTLTSHASNDRPLSEQEKFCSMAPAKRPPMPPRHAPMLFPALPMRATSDAPYVPRTLAPPAAKKICVKTPVPIVTSDIDKDSIPCAEWEKPLPVVIIKRPPMKPSVSMAEKIPADTVASQDVALPRAQEIPAKKPYALSALFAMAQHNVTTSGKYLAQKWGIAGLAVREFAQAAKPATTRIAAVAVAVLVWTSGGAQIHHNTPSISATPADAVQTAKTKIVTSAAQTALPGYAIITENAVCLRRGPGMGFKIERYGQKNQQVAVFGMDGKDWVKVAVQVGRLTYRGDMARTYLRPAP